MVKFDIVGTGNVGAKDLASDTKVTLTQRHFCRESTSNNLEAQDQSSGLCLFLGYYYNLLRLERWTVNPYVASSSLARGARFSNSFSCFIGCRTGWSCSLFKCSIRFFPNTVVFDWRDKI